jgi:ankyrin repeat protein
VTSAKLFHVDASGNRRRLHIDEAALASGADGSIHHVKDQPELIAKCYHNPDKDPLRLNKIQAMLEAPPDLPDIYHREHRYVQIAWPMGWLESPKGRFVGYVMPKVETSKAVPLEVLISKKSRQSAGLPESWGFRVSAAKNLASIIAELHRHGHHVIDLKPINLNVYTDYFYIAVLDCDGFSVKGKNGKRYPAHQFSDGYIAPDVMQKMLYPNQLGEEQDRFALAVILFQLMNQGLHPYQGVPAKGALLPNTNSERIERNLYAYGRKPNRLISPSPWSIHDFLDNETRTLFDRAFTSILDRPSAAEWDDHLRPYAQADPAVIGKCKKNNMHVAFAKGCPWCKMDALTTSANKKKKTGKRPHSSRQKQHKVTVKRSYAQVLAKTQRQANQYITRSANANTPSSGLSGLHAFGIFLVIIIAALIFHGGRNGVSTVEPKNKHHLINHPYQDYDQTHKYSNKNNEPYIEQYTTNKKEQLINSLEIAISYSQTSKVNELILKGENVNAIGARGQSMLNSAITHNSSEIVKMLLVAGADANLTDRNGDTPLSLAAGMNSRRLVELLYSYGASVYRMYPQLKNEIVTDQKLTKQQKINQINYPVQILQKTLLKHDISYEMQDILILILFEELSKNYSWNTLMEAVGNQDLESMLINRGYTELQYTDKNGMTAFDLALITGRLDLAQLLLPTISDYPEELDLHPEAYDWDKPVKLGNNRIIYDRHNPIVNKLLKSDNDKDKLALAYFYVMRPTVDRNVSKSVKLLTQLAANGNPRAAFDLAWCHSRGFGVKVDISYANRLFDIAMSGGIEEAALWKQVFLMYYDNSNVTDAFNQILELAEDGDKFAQYVAGVNLLFPGTQKKNPVKGLSYLKKSVKNGFPAAAFALDYFYRVYSNPRNVIEADRWRERGRKLTRAFLSEIPSNYDYFQFIEYSLVLKGELQAQFNSLIEADGGVNKELSFIRKGAKYIYTGKSP